MTDPVVGRWHRVTVDLGDGHGPTEQDARLIRRLPGGYYRISTVYGTLADVHADRVGEEVEPC